jgi:cytochrome c556
MAALIAAAAFAQTPEELVEKRQEQMKINGSNVRVIAGFVQNGEGTIADVQTAANNINGVAGVIDTLWPEGTAVGVGDSRALPVIWENPDAFAERRAAFQSAAAAVAEAAATGDAEAVKAAFPALGMACGGCHDNFRQPQS